MTTELDELLYELRTAQRSAWGDVDDLVLLDVVDRLAWLLAQNVDARLAETCSGAPETIFRSLILSGELWPFDSAAARGHDQQARAS